MNHNEVKNVDYGFRLSGKPILLYQDRSLAADESTHHMEKALRQMSMEYYTLERCLQCGICSSYCPVHLLKANESFSPRSFIQKTRLGLLDLSGDELWMCTNCGHCQMVCPFEIPLLDVMASLRHLIVEQGAGHVPVSIKSSIASIASFGNPWKEEPANRVKWIQESGISQSLGTEETPIYLFLGCFTGYDRRARQTAEAAMHILQTARIPFKIMAEEEVCCGDTVRRVGDFSTSEKVRKINRDIFLKNHVKQLYVFSPHCFNAFQDMFVKEPECEIQVVPLLELIFDLLHQGLIKLNTYQNTRVTFHDPCFFSKHRGIIDLPRQILDSMTGIERVEMEHYGKNSLCCGGGGGGIWRDIKKGERLSEIRLDEAINCGADILVTSCPYCLSMLEDAGKGDEKYRDIEIMDIFELIGKGIRDENN